MSDGIIVSDENDYDVAIIGSGIVGVASALQIKKDRPDARVVILERNLAPSKEQSSHSSGCVHAGLQYAKGSHMVRLCIEGNQAITKYCKKKGIPIMTTGKLTVARDEQQLKALQDLYRNAKENGVEGIEFVEDKKKLLKLEPGCTKVISAIYTPTSGTVQFGDVSQSLMADFLALPGTALFTGFNVRGLINDSDQIMAPNNCNILRRFLLRRAIRKQVGFSDERVTVVGCETGQTGPFETITSKAVFTAMGIRMDKFAPRSDFCAKYLTRCVPSVNDLRKSNGKWRSLIDKNGYKGIPCEFGFWNYVITPLSGQYLELKESALKRLRDEGKVDLTKHIYPTLIPGDFFSVGTHITPTLAKDGFMSHKERNLPRRSFNNSPHTPGVIIGPLGGLSVDLMAEAGRSLFSDQRSGIPFLMNFAIGGLKQFYADKGFRKLALRHPIICLQQMCVTDKKIYGQAKKLCPYLEPDMLKPSYTGIMAQTFSPKTGGTLEDFVIKLDPRFIKSKASVLHLLNAPSPAATACLALGKDIASVLNMQLQRYETKSSNH
eukprot:GHVH01001482.1.p1 GENE.GHVH01001482.1~~GHVH01001482.1.p1  ORF type:complete len:549 (+),score=60.28 GHVH01001482.1:869-2515(+)